MNLKWRSYQLKAEKNVHKIYEWSKEIELEKDSPPSLN